MKPQRPTVTSTNARPVVVGYIRRSKDDGKDASIEVQRKDILSFVKHHDMDLRRFYIDNDRSGYDPTVDREEWDTLMDDIGVGGIDFVVAYRGDRFTRQGPIEMYEAVRHAHLHGTAFIAADGLFDSRKKGYDAAPSVLTMLAAQEESMRLAKRVGDAKALRRNRGEYVGTRPPYGYTVERINNRRTLVPDSHQAEVLRMIADRLSEGESYAQLARELNAAGERTTTDRLWTEERLRVAITNPSVAGYSVRVEGKNWIINRDPDTDDYLCPWEPIIDPARWWRLRELLSKRRKIASHKSLLGGRGILVCAQCKGPMTGIQPTKGHRQYRCSRRYLPDTNPKKCTYGVAVDMDAMESYVYSTVDRFVANLDVMNTADFGIIKGAARLFNATAQDPTIDARREAINVELAEIHGRLNEVDELFVSGTIDTARYRAMNEQLTTKRDKAQAALAALPQDQDDDIDGVLAWIDHLREQGSSAQWDSKDFFTLARYLIAAIVLRPYQPGDIRGNIDARAEVIWRESLVQV